MPKCFSPTKWGDRRHTSFFLKSGLRSSYTDLADGTIIHCWVPETRKENKPDLVLVHGFGSNAMWQWAGLIRLVVPHFNVHVPDLVFFGDSFTTRADRSESFQARCVMRVMEANAVRRLSVVGVSYGGFVAYSMAAQFPEAVERAVICCAGVCLEEKDLTEGLFRVRDLETAAGILLPQTAGKVRQLMGYAFVKPPTCLPSCLLNDFVHVMYKDYVEQRRELLHAIPKDRKLSELPIISQPTLILWGDQDQIFPLELAHRLQRHLGDISQLVVIKKTGHAFIFEKPREVYKHLKSFLMDSVPLPDKQTQFLSNHSSKSEKKEKCI